mmetsp:Transcript_31528/g.36779  ORF Transcript_31528/g.36779 Transcript_31528/m.36779 type:complete len:403 (+) Transcript_31528:150-1358(+)
MTTITSISFPGTSNNVKATSFHTEDCYNGDQLQNMIKKNSAFEKEFDMIVQSSQLKTDATKTANANTPSQTLIRPARWGLVSAVVAAYNGHHNLVLRPDDVWQAILTQFSFYVNANAEALRDEFVDFKGKKELVIKMGGTLFTADFGSFAKRMVDEQICTNIKDPEVTEWLLPNFTTTTDTDRIVASVTIMSTLQAYFEYSCCLSCGIPNVTLLGSSEDWHLLRQKLDRLLQYDIRATGGKDVDPVMEEWHKLLSKVIDEFIKSVEGNPNLKFWDTVAHHIGGDSGPSYLSGWVTVFSCFKKNGQWQGDTSEYNLWPKIDTAHISGGAVSVPVKLDDNGTEYEANMTAGQVVYEVLGTKSDTIQPRSNWSFAIKNFSTKVRSNSAHPRDCILGNALKKQKHR